MKKRPSKLLGLHSLGFLSVFALGVALFALEAAPTYAESSRDPIPDATLREAAKQGFTSEELAGYDGTNDSRPLLMGVRGLVFDVSPGARFYGPDSRYHPLIARDASRGVARMSLDPADLNDRCDELTDAEWKMLEDVVRDTYIAKYKVVGHVSGGYFFPKGLCCDAEGGPCGGC